MFQNAAVPAMKADPLHSIYDSLSEAPMGWSYCCRTTWQRIWRISTTNLPPRYTQLQSSECTDGGWAAEREHLHDGGEGNPTVQQNPPASPYPNRFVAMAQEYKYTGVSAPSPMLLLLVVLLQLQQAVEAVVCIYLVQVSAGIMIMNTHVICTYLLSLVARRQRRSLLPR